MEKQKKIALTIVLFIIYGIILYLLHKNQVAQIIVAIIYPILVNLILKRLYKERWKWSYPF